MIALELLASVGVTLIVVRGTLFAPLQRLWPALFRCSQCTGTWVGVVAGVTGIVAGGHGPLLDAIIAGGATSLLSLAADAVLLRLLGDPGDPEGNAP